MPKKPKTLMRPGSPEEIIKRVHARALATAEMALLKAEEGGDGSGDIPWKDVSTRVKIGAYLAGKAMDKAVNDDNTKAQFGLLVMQGKIKDHGAWEKMAQAVDKPATDVEAVPVPKLEGK